MDSTTIKDMLPQEVEEYAKLINLNLEEKLQPINETIDQMLIRLEELENMIVIVQQERCNAMGLTGSLTDVVQKKDELATICKRIDVLENAIEHVTNNMNHLETRMREAEERLGVKNNSSGNNNATKLKTLLSPLFKKSSGDAKQRPAQPKDLFSAGDYFVSDGN